MRAVVQRVNEAFVSIKSAEVARISHGFLVLLGVDGTDTSEDASWLAKKITDLRIFDDESGLMNKSILDIQGEILVVSQFTLHASYKKGARPSFIKAAKPDQAQPLYESFCQNLKERLQIQIQTGEFGANMKVSLINNGPVTIFIDTKNKE